MDDTNLKHVEVEVCIVIDGDAPTEDGWHDLMDVFLPFLVIGPPVDLVIDDAGQRNRVG